MMKSKISSSNARRRSNRGNAFVEMSLIYLVYAVMLIVTLVDVAALFAFGRPEWRWLAASYLGLLLIGSALAAVDVSISLSVEYLVLERSRL